MSSAVLVSLRSASVDQIAKPSSTRSDGGRGIADLLVTRSVRLLVEDLIQDGDGTCSVLLCCTEPSDPTRTMTDRNDEKQQRSGGSCGTSTQWCRVHHVPTTQLSPLLF